ncbi:MAG: sulfite exporter TauE/SafE family protein [Spirosomataceae bacterium]
MVTAQFIGFSSSLLIGMSLGLIGGGGSLLTLPVLVYLLGIDPILSGAYSLFVVGATSLVGSVTYMRRALVDYRTALIFVIPSFIAVFLTRTYLLPAIPDPVFSQAGRYLSKEGALMLFFAAVMAAAAYSMMNERQSTAHACPTVLFSRPSSGVAIAFGGAVVGAITGAVGAGGGFLIIPALVLLAHLGMKTAVGTSLFIIAIKSLLGFWGDTRAVTVDWGFLSEFTLLSVIGIFFGSYLSRFIAGEKLKKAFGRILLGMSLCILFKELRFLF